MHPRRSAQEVLPCDLCETAPLHSHCELCNINLCVNCVGKHLSDLSNKHNVMPFSQRMSAPNYPKCSKHPGKHCELHCDKCVIPVCSTCLSSGIHKHHKLSEFLEHLGAKTQSLQNDLEELEAKIHPRYEDMASDVQTEKAELEMNYGKLTTTADQQGEILHREVTAIVNQRKSAIQEMKNKHLSILNKNTEEITQKITELKQIIADLKTIQNSNDISLSSTYKSRNSEFRTLPPKIRVTLPSSSPQKINKYQLNEMFGSLPSLSINTQHGSPFKTLLDEPRLTATINIKYTNGLSNVRCFSGEQVWTRGHNNIINLFNLQGTQLESISTVSGKTPRDLAVTRKGHLVYIDNKTVYLLKNRYVRAVVALQGWVPLNVRSTSCDDLLVSMISDDQKQSKVVRYSGSKEKQTIQFDDQGRHLYSSGGVTSKYISENRNLDICVSDIAAGAVVVVNESGKLRFKYTGQLSNTKESFHPVGITTDSQCHILSSDYDNQCIHILDQDGQFLRYIRTYDLGLPWPWGFLRYLQNYYLERPHDLCVDISDNLFVVEWGTSKVKKIQYLQTQF